MRCLDPPSPRSTSTRARSPPGGGEELESPYVADEELHLRPGRATRSRSRCPRSSRAARTAPGLCPQCGANLNETGPPPRVRARPALGEALRAPLRLTSLPFCTAHGRPQAEAVALAHDQAPVAAQDHRTVAQRVPAVPPAPPPAPRVPALRVLRRSRGRRPFRSRPRSRPRSH